MNKNLFSLTSNIISSEQKWFSCVNKNSFAVFCRSSDGSCSGTCEHGISVAQSFQITEATAGTLLTVTIQAFSDYPGHPRRISGNLTIEHMMPSASIRQTAPPTSHSTSVRLFFSGSGSEEGYSLTYVSGIATFNVIF